MLAQWLDAGFDLGNHTYSHPSLNKVPLAQFEDNIVKGEVIMRPLIEEHGRKLVWFRYPFLDSGMSAEVHQGVLDFLRERHYRVAPVTVDYKDYFPRQDRTVPGNLGSHEKLLPLHPGFQHKRLHA